MKPASNMPETDRQGRIKHLLSDALELEPGSRSAFVDRAASDDPTIAVEVQVLIGAHERASRFLENPTVNGSELCGQTIGRYRLLHLIGEGGFGRVYLAEQREPVTRNVALKIIKPGMDTRQVIARFEAERQALAMMKHPGIATVFDAGATREGRPYFVMEFVEGVAVMEYCDQHNLSISERLNLFIEVCGAVQHAHTKGVIHRDLKPSNLLVTLNDGTPQAKVIDFGIAKATSGSLSGATVSTDGGRFVGTPQYMSPEQADENAMDVDTRSDVYSLGVVLYELLAGVSPFDDQRLRSAGVGEWQRIIREEEPPRLSTRLTTLDTLASIAARRGVEPRRLPALVSGDLDWITLKSLEKDRDRRYNSASELADDLRRHLNHEPVLASPPSTVYRLKKFVRRHRVGVLASCLISLALVCGAVGLTVGMMQAHDSAEEARDAAEQTQAVNDFMREILTSVKPEQDGADVRLVEVMDDASIAASQRFADHPLLEAEVRDLLGSVYSDLSMWNKSGREHKQAMDLWLKWAGADDPRTIGSERMYVGCAINNRQIGEVASRLPDLLARCQRVFGANDLATLDVQRSIGRVQMLQGQNVEAERTFLDVRARLLAHGDDDALHIRTLKDLIHLGRPRAHDSNAAPRRGVMLSQLESLARERVERAVRAYGVDSMISVDAHTQLAQILADQGEYTAAVQSCRTILEMASTRLGECHHVRTEAIEVLAFAAHRLGDSSTAAELNLTEINCVRRLGAPLMLVSAIADALPVLDRGERWVEGESLAREYAELLGEFGGGHGDMAFDADVWVARFVSLQNRLDEAESMFQSLLALAEVIDLEISLRARLHLFHGSNLCRLEAFKESEAELQTAADALEDFRMGTQVANPDDVLIEFIALYNAWGKPEQADEYKAIRELTLANLAIDPG